MLHKLRQRGNLDRVSGRRPGAACFEVVRCRGIEVPPQPMPCARPKVVRPQSDASIRPVRRLTCRRHGSSPAPANPFRLPSPRAQASRRHNLRQARSPAIPGRTPASLSGPWRRCAQSRPIRTDPDSGRPRTPAHHPGRHWPGGRTPLPPPPATTHRRRQRRRHRRANQSGWRSGRRSYWTGHRPGCPRPVRETVV